MSDDNKIQFDIELNEGSVESAFKVVDQRAAKSAKDSAASFEAAFKNQEMEWQRLVKESAKLERTLVDSGFNAATKSARESASAFEQAFQNQKYEIETALSKIFASEDVKKSAQDSAKVFEQSFKESAERAAADAARIQSIYQASQTQNIQQAMNNIIQPDRLRKSAQESAQVFEESFNSQKMDGILQRMANLYLSLNLVVAALRLMRQAGEFTLDQVFAGEKIQRVNEQFNMLAQNAGVAAQTLRSELVGAADGLVDDTDLLKAANFALVNIGENADKLPQILNAARKAASLTGEDTVSAFQNILNSINGLQTKQLKNYNIIIDQNKVYADYARALGVSADRLSETGKRNAILNEVLLQSETRLKNVKLETDTASAAWQRLKVSVANATEAMQVRLAKSPIGDFIRETSEELRLRLDGVPERMKTIREQSAGQLLMLQRDLGKIIDETAKLPWKEKMLSQVGITDSDREQRLKQWETYLNDVNKLLAEKSGRSFREVQDEGMKPRQGVTPNPNTDIEKFKMSADEIKTQRQQLNQAILQSEIGLQNDLIAARQAGFDAQGQRMTQEQIDQQVFNEQKKAVESQFQLDMMTLKDQYKNLDKSNKDEYDALVVSMEAAKNEKLKNLQNAHIANAQKGWENLKSIFQGAFVNGIVASMQAYSRALKDGENANKAFADSIIASLGNLAVQIGSMLMAVGLGFSAAGAILPPWAAAGAGTFAAGLGLVALGTAMQAQGGGGGGAAAPIGGGGSAGAGAGQDSSTMTQPIQAEETEAQTPQTNIAINVNGNILDRRETGLELSQILKDEFENQGLVFMKA